MTYKPLLPEADETALIAAVRRDPRAFAALYQRYVERVFRYLYSRTGSTPEAEDLTSQTFLAAFETFDRFRQEGHFASWLFTIARNKAMDHFRRRKPQVGIDAVEDLPQEDDPLQAVIRAERITVLSGLIRALTEDEQELLRLRFLAGLSFPEIASLLQANEEALKKSLYRLLARLQSQVEVNDD